MLTIDEYIAKMKRMDKLDEFDYVKMSENMAAVIKYVMTYFSEYLTMESCDAEELKFKRTVTKLQEEISSQYSKSAEFIIGFYLQHRIKIQGEIDKWLKSIPYFVFFYSDDDFESLAISFCSSYKLVGVDMNKHLKEVRILIAEIKTLNTCKPDPSDMLHLDNNIVSWVNDTYRDYGVDLLTFASDTASTYYTRYVKYERDHFSRQGYYVNNYNHRYNKNPFNQDQVYDDNKHRPFLANRRGELEMLVMHEWLFSEVYDEDYWPEYVNLCIAHGRVSLAQNVNGLIPVAISGLNYPNDVPYSMGFVVTSDGCIQQVPETPYFCRVDFTPAANTWQSVEEMEGIITSLNKSFKQYGAPKVLELMAPTKTASFNEEIFLLCCSRLEKKLKKYAPMKIAIVNGSGNQRSKPPSYLCTVEDILRLRSLLRERKIHFQYSIDFPALIGTKRDTRFNQTEVFGALAEIKNSIICISMTNTTPQTQSGLKIRSLNNEYDSYHLNRYRYPTYSDIFSRLSTMFNDNQHRYLIPKNIKSDIELETLVDNLLRSGFAFCNVGEQND